MSRNKADIIQQACDYISACEHLPSLGEVANHIGYSPSHFHRLFCQALGISPRDYADAERLKSFRQNLKNDGDISDALYKAGYSSTSRLYEFSNLYLGMTPKSYQQGGKGETIWFQISECPLGYILIAATKKGICSAHIDDDKNKLKQKLYQEFYAAELLESDKKLQDWTQKLINYLAGDEDWPLLPYDVKATAFQRKVWDWLRTIPPGKTYHYNEVAAAIGQPNAARAVARACASNEVALVIPCHRIVPKSGGVGGYKWHPKRKTTLLETEKQLSDKK